MIIWLPIALFVVGLAGVYLRGGWLRLTATLALVVSAAWSLVFLTHSQVGAGWVLGPLLATLLLTRPAASGRLTFEALSRRAITLASTLLVAIFAASKFPIGENPTLLTAVPWLVGAVGAAWLVSPLDERERAQSLVLMIGAGGCVLLSAFPVGVLTAVVSGALAIVPAIVARWALSPAQDRVVRVLLVLAATVATALALVFGTLGRPRVADFSFSLDGPALLATAVLIVAGVLMAAPGRSWLVSPGLMAVLAVAPSVRWAALAVLVAASFDTERRQERIAWLALLLLAITPLFSTLVSQPWSPRAQVVGLAGTLVLMAIAAQASQPPVLVLAATALAILQATASANPGAMARFQWVAAGGAVVLVAGWLLARGRNNEGFEVPVILGLLLLAVAAHDSLGLGALAAALLVINLIVMRGGAAFDASRPHSGRARVFLALAGSGWPPTVRFAGITLAVIAALQTSLAWGLLAATLLVALKLAPRAERSPARRGERPPSALQAWLPPALSLLCGVAPALVLRMLRV